MSVSLFPLTLLPLPGYDPYSSVHLCTHKYFPHFLHHLQLQKRYITLKVELRARNKTYIALPQFANAAISMTSIKRGTNCTPTRVMLQRNASSWFLIYLFVVEDNFSEHSILNPSAFCHSLWSSKPIRKMHY